MNHESRLTVEVDGICLKCRAEAGDPDAERVIWAILRYLPPEEQEQSLAFWVH